MDAADTSRDKYERRKLTKLYPKQDDRVNMKPGNQREGKPENAGVEHDRKQAKGDQVDWQQQEFEYWLDDPI